MPCFHGIFSPMILFVVLLPTLYIFKTKRKRTEGVCVREVANLSL